MAYLDGTTYSVVVGRAKSESCSKVTSAVAAACNKPDWASGSKQAAHYTEACAVLARTWWAMIPWECSAFATDYKALGDSCCFVGGRLPTHSYCKGQLGVEFEVAPYRTERCRLDGCFGKAAKGIRTQDRLGQPDYGAAMRLDFALGEDLAQLASQYQKRQDHLPLESTLNLVRPITPVSTKSADKVRDAAECLCDQTSRRSG